MNMNLMEQYMNFVEQWAKAEAEKYHKMVLDVMNKEEPMMKATYNGFTGEVVCLERNEGVPNYSLTLYDSEKGVTYSFDCVYQKDIKFLCGTVSFSE